MINQIRRLLQRHDPAPTQDESERPERRLTPWLFVGAVGIALLGFHLLTLFVLSLVAPGGQSFGFNLFAVNAADYSPWGDEDDPGLPGLQDPGPISIAAEPTFDARTPVAIVIRQEFPMFMPLLPAQERGLQFPGPSSPTPLATATTIATPTATPPNTPTPTLTQVPEPTATAPLLAASTPTQIAQVLPPTATTKVSFGKAALRYRGATNSCSTACERTRS
ncbi:MAG: hypothetical protein HC876_12650 [Chloroflexaceae bacterium]|nr:hypothetical protein [Chloroflexaceae bacterium]